DIAPTIAELAGIPWGADGKSIVPLLDQSAQTVRDAALLSYCEGASYPCQSALQLDPGKDDPGSQAAVPSYWGGVTERSKCAEYVTGEKELYDLAADPAELVNEAGNPDYASVQQDLAVGLSGLRAPPPPDTTIATGPQGPLDARTAAFTYFTQSRF